MGQMGRCVYMDAFSIRHLLALLYQRGVSVLKTLLYVVLLNFASSEW